MNNELDPIISQERVHKLLAQALAYAEKAYNADDEVKKQTYLANIMGTLNTLTTLYDPGEDSLPHTQVMFEEESFGKKAKKFLTGN